LQVTQEQAPVAPATHVLDDHLADSLAACRVWHSSRNTIRLQARSPDGQFKLSVEEPIGRVERRRAVATGLLRTRVVALSRRRRR
jgi:hypothetical protein